MENFQDMFKSSSTNYESQRSSRFFSNNGLKTRFIAWFCESLKDNEFLENLTHELKNEKIKSIKDKAELMIFLDEACKNKISEIILVTTASSGKKCLNIINSFKIISEVYVIYSYQDKDLGWTNNNNKVKCISRYNMVIEDQIKNRILIRQIQSEEEEKKKVIEDLKIKSEDYYKMFIKSKRKKDFREASINAKSFLEHYSKCLSLQEDEYEKEEIMKSVQKAYNEYYNYLNDHVNSYDDKISHLEKLKNLDLFFQIKVLIITSLSRLNFNYGLEFFNRLQYIRSQALFNHAKTYSMSSLEVKEYLSSETIEELIDIEESAKFYINSTQIQLIIKQGDSYYNMAVNDSEYLDMESIILSLDLYREAYMLTQISKENERIFDLESEAIVCSKLAMIFFKILKNFSKAETYSDMSIQLAMSIPYRNFGSENWFKESLDIKKEIRKKKEKEEREKYSEQREKYKGELAEDFKKIEEASKKEIKLFLKFLVTNYPYAQGFSFDVEAEEKKTNMKKILLKFSSYYQPDKFSSEDNLKKKILMEEISKHVNCKYDYYK
jgi:hypothetical protein